MSNYSNNPDWPENVGSFMNHTSYGQQQVGTGFFYGGMGCAPMPDTGARRPDGLMPQQPAPQQYGYGYAQPNPNYPQTGAIPPQSQIPTGVGQMLATPEQGVQPFSSYPPAGPTAGFNQLMTEARRADAGTASAMGANPWAQTQPQVTPQPMPMPSQMYATPNMYPVPMGNSAGYADAQAMYQYGPQMMGNNPFERRPGMNMWDNMYTTPQPIIPMNQPMWNTQPVAPQPTTYQFPTGAPSMMPPPIQQAPTPSWTELSHNSFNK
jgi:hypothetical protein